MPLQKYLFLKKIPDFTDIVAIACGGTHSLAINSKGDVFSWGRGDLGQLGHPKTESRLSPTKIESLSNITGIAAGSDNAMAINSEGSVYYWGIKQTTPKLIGGLSDVNSAACGTEFCVILKNDGSIWTVSIKANQPNYLVPVTVSLPKTIAIACGGTSALALTDTGEVYNWGTIVSYGAQTSQATVIEPTIVAKNCLYISCHAYHAMVINEDHQLISWGMDSYGRLGRPEISHDTGTDAQREKNQAAQVVQLPKGTRWHFCSHKNYPYENIIYYMTVKWPKMRFLVLGFKDSKSHFYALPQDLLFHFAYYLYRISK